MAIRYKDYYESLGVARGATQEEIKKAYRKLARKYHPDVSKAAGAADRFKELNEAYEVLGDAENRKKYDRLGANWKSGQEFRPPAGWEHVHFDVRGTGGGAAPPFGDAAGFSDFFESLFGMGAGGGMAGGGRGRPRAYHGEDHEAALRITLEEAYRGGRKTITLQSAQGGVRGVDARRRFDVNIPAGVVEGDRIRLGGQGGVGAGGGEAGDLYLTVAFEAHPVFRVAGRDLECDLPLAPWEAALGAKVNLAAPGGAVALNLPAGTQSGQRLRLKGKGLPGRGGHAAGDLYAVVQIRVPARLTARERELFEALAEVSRFEARK